MADSTNKKFFAWLALILVIAALLVLWIVISKCFWCLCTWKDLLHSLIPNFLAPIIVFVIIYIIFESKGIDIFKALRGTSPKWVQNAYESFDQIKWTPYIRGTNSIVIVAFFFEEWIQKYTDEFDKFLSKDEATLQIYLPDYTNLVLLTKLNELIPEHNQIELAKKIENSIERIQILAKDRNQKVSVKLYGHPFRYTYQRFNKKLFLSINELARDKNYKSPFFVFNLEHSKVLTGFFNRETTALEQASYSINLSQWKRSPSNPTI